MLLIGSLGPLVLVHLGAFIFVAHAAALPASFLIFQTQPRHTFQNGIYRSLSGTFTVPVFNTQYKSSAMLSGV